MLASVPRWQAALAEPGVGIRPDGSTWSVLEYAAHVRDLCRVFETRLRLMLDQDNPDFPDWDQDAAAVEGHTPAWIRSPWPRSWLRRQPRRLPASMP